MQLCKKIGIEEVLIRVEVVRSDHPSHWLYYRDYWFSSSKVSLLLYIILTDATRIVMGHGPEEPRLDSGGFDNLRRAQLLQKSLSLDSAQPGYGWTADNETILAHFIGQWENDSKETFFNLEYTYWYLIHTYRILLVMQH